MKLAGNSERRISVFVVLENFLKREAFSGILLFAAAIAALFWANSPWSDSYFDLWETSVEIAFGDHVKEMHLVEWVNDGLMAVFFLLIGLEIKRELLVGELSSWRKAAFPIVGALGGMLLPLAFYVIINLQSDGEVHGFGVPMATDIAFALGFLLLLGSRIPLTLKIFLTSLAVFDDLGAVVVVAGFYTESLDLVTMGYAALTFGGLVCLNLMGAKKLWPYLMLGIVLWFCVLGSGIHATVAGVLLALTVPVKAKIDSEQFLEIARCELQDIEGEGYNSPEMILTAEQQDSLEILENAYQAVQNPLVRLEHQLHPFSAYVVMPVFALANAGVEVSGIDFSLLNPVGLGILLGLILGKPLGIAGATYLAVQLRLVQKPANLSWGQIGGAALLGGVGFTMAIFVSHLAFDDDEVVALSKLLIVCCSVFMGLVGIFTLSRTCPADMED